MKKFFKVSLLLVLCLILTFAFVACADNTGGTTPPATNEQGGESTTGDSENTDDGGEVIAPPSINIGDLEGDALKIMQSVNNLLGYEGLSFTGNVTATSNTNTSINQDITANTKINTMKLNRTSNGYAFRLTTVADGQEEPRYNTDIYYPNDDTGFVYYGNHQMKPSSDEVEYSAIPKNKLKFKYSEISTMIDLMGGEGELANQFISKFVTTLYDFDNMKTDAELKTAFINYILATLKNTENFTLVDKKATITFKAEEFLTAIGITKLNEQPILASSFEDIILELTMDDDNTLSAIKLTISSKNKVQGVIENVEEGQKEAFATNRVVVDIAVKAKGNDTSSDDLIVEAPKSFVDSNYSKLSFDFKGDAKELADKFTALMTEDELSTTVDTEIKVSGLSVEETYNTSALTLNGKIEKASEMKAGEKVERIFAGLSLVGLPELVLDEEGNPVLDEEGNPIFKPSTEPMDLLKLERYKEQGFVYQLMSLDLLGLIQVEDFTMDTASRGQTGSLLPSMLFETTSKVPNVKLMEGVNLNLALDVTKVKTGYTLELDFSKIFLAEREDGVFAPMNFVLKLNVLVGADGKITAITMDDIVEEEKEEIDGVEVVTKRTEIKNTGVSFKYGTDVDTTPSFADRLSDDIQENIDNYFKSSDIGINEIKASDNSVAVKDDVTGDYSLTVNNDSFKTDITITLRDKRATLLVDESILEYELGCEEGSFVDNGDGTYTITNASIRVAENIEIPMCVKAVDGTTDFISLYVTRNASSNVNGIIDINGTKIETKDFTDFKYLVGGEYNGSDISIKINAEAPYNNNIVVDPDGKFTRLADGSLLLVGNTMNEIEIVSTAEDGTATQKFIVQVNVERAISPLGDLLILDNASGCIGKNFITKTSATDGGYTVNVYREYTEGIIDFQFEVLEEILRDRLIFTEGSFDVTDSVNGVYRCDLKFGENIFTLYVGEELEPFTLTVNAYMVFPVDTTINGTDDAGASCMSPVELKVVGDTDGFKYEQTNGNAYVKEADGKITLNIASAIGSTNGLKLEYIERVANADGSVSEVDMTATEYKMSKGTHNCVMRLSDDNYNFEYDFVLTSAYAPEITVGGYNATFNVETGKYEVDVVINEEGKYSIASSVAEWEDAKFTASGLAEFEQDGYGIFNDIDFNITLANCKDYTTDENGIPSIVVDYKIDIRIHLALISFKTGEGETPINAELVEDVDDLGVGMGTYHYEIKVEKGTLTGMLAIINDNAYEMILEGCLSGTNVGDNEYYIGLPNGKNTFTLTVRMNGLGDMPITIQIIEVDPAPAV